MTKKDFKIIAEIIKKVSMVEPVSGRMICIFAEEPAKTNSNFDADKFKKACVL